MSIDNLRTLLNTKHHEKIEVILSTFISFQEKEKKLTNEDSSALYEIINNVATEQFTNHTELYLKLALSIADRDIYI